MLNQYKFSINSFGLMKNWKCDLSLLYLIQVYLKEKTGLQSADSEYLFKMHFSWIPDAHCRIGCKCAPKNSYTFTAKQQVKRNIFWCAIATCSTVCDAAVNILYLFIQFLEWYFNDDKCFQIWNWFTRMYRSSICSPQGNIYKFYSSSNRFGCTYISE